MPMLIEAMRLAARRLQAAGVSSASLDARLLLAYALGQSPEQLLTTQDKILSDADAACFETVVMRRAAREPVSRIVGRREFWSLEFEITPDTLDPRADSETLISAACDVIKDRSSPLRILDIGAGSGCLLLALLAEFHNAQGVGIDVSLGALGVARANAARLGFAARAKFILCDIRRDGWPEQLGGQFDLVISNPPYIPDGLIAGLMPEVARHDPWQALAGGADGLDFYRIITNSAAQLLASGGALVLEVGRGQPAMVADLLRGRQMTVLPPFCDISGVERAIVGRPAIKTVENPAGGD